jgi:hypothetical protein
MLCFIEHPRRFVICAVMERVMEISLMTIKVDKKLVKSGEI